MIKLLLVLGIIFTPIALVLSIRELITFEVFVRYFSNIITKKKTGQLYEFLRTATLADTHCIILFTSTGYLSERKSDSFLISYSGKLDKNNKEIGIIRGSLAHKIVKLKIKQLKRAKK